MKVFLVILVAVVAVVGVIAVTGVLDEGPPMPAAVDVPVPAGAVRLEPGTSPNDVAMSAGGAPGGMPGGMVGGGGAGYVGMWTPEGDWYASLLQMKKGDGVTRMSLDVQGTTLGYVYLYLTVPGDVGEIAEGKKVTFRGRIVSITPSDRIDIKPHKIELDQVTVIRTGG